MIGKRATIVALSICICFGLYLSGTSIGSAELAEPQPFTVAKGPSSIAAGDIDGDGDEDLVMACNGDMLDNVKTLQYLDNTGDGFESRAEPWSGAPYSAQLGDMDADGDPDLVVVNARGNSTAISVFANDGAGTFQEVWYENVSGFFIGEIEILDVNGDSKLDFSYLGGYNELLFTARGSDHYDRVDLDLSSYSDYAWSDLDDDGDPDLLISYSGMYSEPVIAVYENPGNGTVTKAWETQPSFEPNTIATAKIGGTDRVFVGDDDNGTIEVFSVGWPTSGLDHIRSIALGEDADLDTFLLASVDSDPALELVVSCTIGYIDYTLSIFDDPLDGGEASQEVALPASSSAIVVFDADGDSLPDLAGCEGSSLLAGNKAWVVTHATGDGGDSGDGDGSGDGTGDQNTTDDDGDNNDSPGFAVGQLAVAVGIAAVVVWLSRRRR